MDKAIVTLRAATSATEVARGPSRSSSGRVSNFRYFASLCSNLRTHYPTSRSVSSSDQVKDSISIEFMTQQITRNITPGLFCEPKKKKATFADVNTISCRRKGKSSLVVCCLARLYDLLAVDFALLYSNQVRRWMVSLVYSSSPPSSAYTRDWASIVARKVSPFSTHLLLYISSVKMLLHFCPSLSSWFSFGVFRI